MNKNQLQKEGWMDRAKAGWTGVKTGIHNVGTGVAAIAAGVPLKLTNVQDAKIQQLFSSAQSRMKPFIGKLNSNNLDIKLNAEIEVKKQLLGFIRDFMKMTGEKQANNVIATLQQPQYKSISDYLLKIGISGPTSTKKPTSTKPSKPSKPIRKPTPKPAPTPAPAAPAAPTPTPAAPAAAAAAPTPTSGVPKDGATDATGNFKFDAAKSLWVNVATGKALPKNSSDAKTIGYWNAVKKGLLVPEGISKITYKEFFV